MQREKDETKRKTNNPRTIAAVDELFAQVIEHNRRKHSYHLTCGPLLAVHYAGKLSPECREWEGVLTTGATLGRGGKGVAAPVTGAAFTHSPEIVRVAESLLCLGCWRLLLSSTL